MACKYPLQREVKMHTSLWDTLAVQEHSPFHSIPFTSYAVIVYAVAYTCYSTKGN